MVSGPTCKAERSPRVFPRPHACRRLREAAEKRDSTWEWAWLQSDISGGTGPGLSLAREGSASSGGLTPSPRSRVRLPGQARPGQAGASGTRGRRWTRREMAMAGTGAGRRKTGPRDRGCVYTGELREEGGPSFHLGRGCRVIENTA